MAINHNTEDDIFDEPEETVADELDQKTGSKTALTKVEGVTSILSESQTAFLTQQTPAKYIKTRPGRGGKTFRYVTVGYVTNVLNAVFGRKWSWKIIDKQIGKAQLWVLGELTVWDDHGMPIVKSAFGGSDNKGVDIGDDLKSASSDALKKAASMLGVAADLYGEGADL